MAEATNNVVVLNDTTHDMVPEKIDKIKVPLLLNQRLMIHELTQRERGAKLEDENGVMYQNVNFVNDPMGSGKTLIALGLHAYNSTFHETPVYVQRNVVLPARVKPEINVRLGFAKLYPNGYIKATMVLVCNATLNHWLNEIKTKTTLSVLPMRTVRDLNKFEKEFKDIAEGKYDIILVNNYRTTRKYSLMDKVNDIAGYRFWQRFVPDDISTVPIHNAIGMPLALSYVIPFSNSDKREMDFVIKTSYVPNEEAQNEPVRKLFATPFRRLCEGSFVENHPDIINRAIIIPKIDYYEYTLINPNKAAIGILKDLNLTEEEMIELNNDNLEEIASRMNVRVKSIFDLAHRLLGNLLHQTDKYQKIIEKIKESFTKEKHFANYRLETELQKVDEMKIPNVDSSYDEWNNVSSDLKKRVEENMVKLRNLQENLEYKECQNCGLEFEGKSNALMTPCCQYVFCHECIIVDNKSGKEKKPCLHCGRSNTFKDLLLIPFDIIENIETVEKNLMDKKEIKLESAESPSKNCPISQGKVSKLELLKHILETEKPRLKPAVVDYKSPNLLKGSGDIAPKMTDRKYVVFGAAKHHEIAKELNEMGIATQVLDGNQQRMKKTLTDFRSSKIKAIVVNMRTDFAGFDECSHGTDCIFMGNLQNDVQLEQSIARIHRKGKKFNTRVHFIRYNTEPHYVSK